MVLLNRMLQIFDILTKIDKILTDKNFGEENFSTENIQHWPIFPEYLFEKFYFDGQNFDWPPKFEKVPRKLLKFCPVRYIQ